MTPLQFIRITALRDDAGNVSEYERLRLIGDIESSEELHRVLLGAPQSMRKLCYLAAVIAHPRCSEGTAYFVYWALNPARHYQLLKRRKPFSKHNEEIWTVLMKIEEQVRKKQFMGDPIAFDLVGFLGRSFEQEAQCIPGAFSVPEFMRLDVAGLRVE